VSPIRLFSLVVVLAVALPAGVRAGAVLQLTSNTSSEANTDAVLDVLDNVHVVYERDGGIYYRSRTGTTWSAEEVVATGTNPAVGAGASGVPQVAFLSGGNTVMFTARLAGTWTAPVPIAAGSYVDLAVDANDVAHVVYLGDTYGDGYRDINYTNDAGGAFPASPIKVWDSWYYYDGWGRSANYYFDFAPILAVDSSGNYAIAYSFRWISGGPGWNDWGTSVHVYQSATDTDVSNADRYKGYYPAPGKNGLTLADTGTAYLAFGTTLATLAGAWSESALPPGSSYSLDTSPAPAVHVAYVNGSGGISYAEDAGGGFGTPLVLDSTTSGRNPVVIAQTDPFVAYEAVDSGDYEVWFARTTNQAPVLDPVGDKSVNEGANLSFAVSATDGDGDDLTYSASNLPTGASFDPATRTFSWTPGFDQAGAYTTVTFQVTDGTDTGSETITITVNDVNAPPVLGAIGDRSVDEAATLTFTLSATDVDGNALTYGASNLPTGATFDPGTRTFSWTPTYDQAGTYANVAFEVTDDGIPNLSDSEAITITVADVNRAPLLSAIGGQSVDEGATLAFTVSATDADGNILTYAASGLPTGASFNPASRTFSWTPTYQQAGSYPGVAFTVTDDGTPNRSDSETITISVNEANAPPVLAAIGDRSVSEAATVSFTVSATDEDGNALTYGASNLPTGATFDPGTRTFSWTPTYQQAGSYPGVVFTVTDDGTPNRSDSETITLTVDDVNRSPVLDAIGDRSAVEGDTLSFTVSATDEDGDMLTYGASNLPTGAIFDAGTRTFSWTPGYDQAGTYAAVVFTVADALAVDSESITITVDDNPTPPGFFTVVPCRVLDTRKPDDPYGGPALVAGSDRTFTIAGQCNIPSTAVAVSVNLTVTQPSAGGNLRLYPAGIPLPLVSTINYAPGQTRANNAIVPLSAEGEMAVRCGQASGTVHFILDVNGYFQGGGQ
jgi:hypothetical protein